MKQSPFSWELAGFLYFPMALRYADRRYNLEPVWWLYYFTLILLYLIFLHKGRLILEVSLEKAVRGYLLCIGGYFLLSVWGVYNVFNPVDLPLLLFTFGYFFFKYRLFHLLFRRHEFYEPYMALTRLYQHIGRVAYLPSFPLKRNKITLPFFSVFMIKHGVLNLTKLNLWSLPSDWLEKVPDHIRIIDLAGNRLEKTWITKEHAKSFMDRKEGENELVVINYLDNPFVEKHPIPDVYHPRLFILSNNEHQEVIREKIENQIGFRLSEEQKQLIKEEDWRLWDGFFYDLEKKEKIVLAWEKCLEIFSSSLEERTKDLMMLSITLAIAYSENACDEDHQYEIKIP